jgi:hypothetical protein
LLGSIGKIRVFREVGSNQGEVPPEISGGIQAE